MAIAFDASSGSKGAGSSTLTWSHTCSGSNRTLVVGCASKTDDYITGVTYNGVAMTQVDKTTGGGGGAEYMYILANPASGANNIVVTASVSIDMMGSAVSYTGTSLTQPGSHSKGATTGAGSGALSLNTSNTMVGNYSWLVGAGFCYTSVDYSKVSEGSNVTDRGNSQYAAWFSPGEYNVLMYDYNAVITGSPSYALNTNTNSAGHAYYASQILAEISPFSSPATSSTFLSLL